MNVQIILDFYWDSHIYLELSITTVFFSIFELIAMIIVHKIMIDSEQFTKHLVHILM